MALLEVSVSNRAQLISAMESFATTNLGWDSASGGVFRCRSTDPTTFSIADQATVSPSGVASYDYIRMRLNNSSATDNLAHSTRICGMMRIYNFDRVFLIGEGNANNGYWMNVIVLMNGHTSNMMSFGYLDSYGNTRYAYITGTNTRRTTTLTSSPERGDILSFDGPEFSGPFNDPDWGSSSSYLGVLYNETTNASYRASRFNSDRFGGGWPSTLALRAYQASRNVVSNRAILNKFKIWKKESGSSIRQFAGEAPFYFVNMTGLSGGQQITDSTGTYIVFPVWSQTANPPADREYLISYNYGVAIKIS